MSKIKIAISGYGNIGKYAAEAVKSSPDMELAGIISQSVAGNGSSEQYGAIITDDIKKLDDVDVVLVCKHTRGIREDAEKYLEMGINTIDTYDVHGDIYDLKMCFDKIAKQNNAVSIISAGWDPGSDSVIRALMEACAPKGITYTNFGPGMSMGHTTAVKSMPGVKDALSITIPLASGVHRRMVYIVLEDGADFEKVSATIKSDPYFVHDDTYVKEVDDIEAIADMGHGVNIIRKGVSGQTHNQIFEFNMKINNPALTAQVMVCSARASMKQKPGAYTMIEIPVIDLLYGDREHLIKKLV